MEDEKTGDEQREKEKAEEQEYPTPEQQRDIIKKIENDKTLFSYFICKSWFHQWKAHVDYDGLGSTGLDGIVTQQPMRSQSGGLVRKGTKKAPGLALMRAHYAATANGEEDDDSDDDTEKVANLNEVNKIHSANDHSDPIIPATNQKAVPDVIPPASNHIPDASTNSTNVQSDWGDSSDDQAAILPSSSSSSSTPRPQKSSPSFLRRKPKLTRVCKNSSKTKIDDSFEVQDHVETPTTERVRPINPVLTGLRAEGRKEGDKPDANESITEIFEQVSDEYTYRIPHPILNLR